MAGNRFNVAPANSMSQIVIRAGSVQVPDKNLAWERGDAFALFVPDAGFQHHLIRC